VSTIFTPDQQTKEHKNKYPCQPGMSRRRWLSKLKSKNKLPEVMSRTGTFQVKEPELKRRNEKQNPPSPKERPSDPELDGVEGDKGRKGRKKAKSTLDDFRGKLGRKYSLSVPRAITNTAKSAILRKRGRNEGGGGGGGKKGGGKKKKKIRKGL